MAFAKLVDSNNERELDWPLDTITSAQVTACFPDNPGGLVLFQVGSKSVFLLDASGGPTKLTQGMTYVVPVPRKTTETAPSGGSGAAAAAAETAAGAATTASAAAPPPVAGTTAVVAGGAAPVATTAASTPSAAATGLGPASPAVARGPPRAPTAPVGAVAASTRHHAGQSAGVLPSATAGHSAASTASALASPAGPSVARSATSSQSAGVIPLPAGLPDESPSSSLRGTISELDPGQAGVTTINDSAVMAPPTDPSPATTPASGAAPHVTSATEVGVDGISWPRIAGSSRAAAPTAAEAAAAAAAAAAASSENEHSGGVHGTSSGSAGASGAAGGSSSGSGFGGAPAPHTGGLRARFFSRSSSSSSKSAGQRMKAFFVKHSSVDFEKFAAKLSAVTGLSSKEVSDMKFLFAERERVTRNRWTAVMRWFEPLVDDETETGFTMRDMYSVVTLPYFHGMLSGDDARRLLAQHNDGAFLVRFSGEPRGFAFSVAKAGGALHWRLRGPEQAGGQYFLEDDRYTSLEAFRRRHSETPLDIWQGPSRPVAHVALTQPVPRPEIVAAGGAHYSTPDEVGELFGHLS